MSSRWSLRPFRKSDLQVVADIYRCAVREIAPGLYTKEQVEAWARFADDLPTFGDMMSRGFRIVIESDAGLEAFALLDPSDYISLLYCRARASRQGHAGRLLQELESEARRLGVTRVHTAASLISHPLFLRHGYVVDHPERVERHGVLFDRYRMSKQLSRD